MKTKLTRLQLEELELLDKEPQPTFGRDRVRIQKALTDKGFACYMRGTKHLGRYGAFASSCEITNAGRSALIANAARRKIAASKRTNQETYPVDAIASQARCRLMSGSMTCKICFHDILVYDSTHSRDLDKDETFTFLADGRTVHWRCLYKNPTSDQK